MGTPCKGLGHTFKVTISASLTAILHVHNIDGPDVSVGQTETTDLTSTSRSFLPTITDGGTVSIQCWYDPAETTQAALTTLMNTPAVRACQLALATATPATWSFSAFVTATKVTNMAIEDSTLGLDVTFKVTGAITIA